MFIGWLLLLRHILKLTKEGHYQNDIDCFFKHKIHKQTHYRQQGGLEKRNKMTWTYIQHVPCVLLALAGRQHTAVAFAAEEGRADPRSVRLVDRGLELRIRQPTLVDDEKSFCLLLHCCCCCYCDEVVWSCRPNSVGILPESFGISWDASRRSSFWWRLVNSRGGCSFSFVRVSRWDIRSVGRIGHGRKWSKEGGSTQSRRAVVR